MKSPRNLRLQIRLCQGALVLLLGLSAVAAAATHQLLLDAANRPTSDLDIGGGHVVGTLDAGRLPAAVPQLDGSGNLTIAGVYQFAGSSAFLAGYYNVLNLNNEIESDGYGNVYIVANLSTGSSLSVAGNLVADTDGNLYVDNGLLLSASSGSVIDGDGNMNPTMATFPPIDRRGIGPPASGILLYASTADGKLHALDAAGSDHALW